MTRIYYLQRLAFGNNAFEPPEVDEDAVPPPSSPAEGSERIGERPAYVQQYDAKGQPINDATAELKRNLGRAQNDVLVTVGVCARTKDGGLPLSGDGPRSQPHVVVRQENQDGAKLDTAYLICTSLCSPWLVGTRHRLQTFGFLAGIPLTQLLRLEWQTWGLWAFLYPNFFMGNFLSFKRGDLLDLFHPSAAEREPESTKLSGYAPLTKTLRSITFFTLMAPLEVYGILQALGIRQPLCLFSSPWTYCSILFRLLGIASFRENDHFSLCRRVQIRNLVPLFPLLAYYYAWGYLQTFCARYICAAIPKIDNPESTSILDNHHHECLMYFNDPSPGKSKCKTMSVKDVLASDLQTVGRLWQNLMDTVTHMPYLSHTRSSGWNGKGSTVGSSNVSQASESTVEDLPDDLREAMATLPSLSQEPGGQNGVLGMRPEFQDLLDPMPSVTGSLAPMAARQHTQMPSPLAAEDSAQPPAIEADAREEDADIVEIVEETSSGDDEDHDAAPAGARFAQVRNVHTRSRRSSSTPHTRSRTSSPAPPIGLSTSRSPDGYSQLEVSIPMDLELNTVNPGFRVPSTDSSESGDSAESSSDSEVVVGTQRLTLLSDFPARTMVGLLATQLTDLALLPLEAYVLRSVALAFWPSPGLAIGIMSPAIRWTNDIYSPRSWFGLGIRAGGWRGAVNYGGKMLLISGIQFAVGLSIWQAGYWWAWWRGRTKYRWGKLKE